MRTWAVWPAVLMMFACTGYGSMRPSSIGAGKIQAFIDARFEDMHAAYCGGEAAPTAILLDLKSDSVRLGGAGWTPVNGKDQLVRMIFAMQKEFRTWGLDVGGPRLSEILDASGSVVGYLYSPVDETIVRPDGADYTVDTVTWDNIRERADPGIRGMGA